MLTGWMGGSERAQFSIVGGLFALAVLNAWLLVWWSELSRAPRKFLVPLIVSVAGTLAILIVMLWTLVRSGLL